MLPSFFRRILLLLCGVSVLLTLPASARSLEITFPASSEPGKLSLGVTYRFWIPDGVARLRGVIVHQHGCGAGSNRDAVTAADDLQWQALAGKWDCALLGPVYHQAETDNCRLWCDPRNGSEQTFLRALAEAGRQSAHPELEEVPWCLWGHSGGGFWSSLMLTLHPERIVAIWLRSGSAFGAWEKGEIPRPELPPAVYEVPIVFNGGAKEDDDPKHGPARIADRAMFKSWREHGAPVAYARDPRTGHECGESRSLAIPYLDACLALRLPPKGSASQVLPRVEAARGWMAPMLKGTIQPAEKFPGEAAEFGWLPSESVARAWQQYVETGSTEDTTPPPAPTDFKASGVEGRVILTWKAQADLESGLQSFVIQRDGQPWLTSPEKAIARFGRPLFQGLTYGDTPAQPLRQMTCTDADAKPGASHRYSIVAINGAGLKSQAVEAVFSPSP